jgi:Domain of Unknown Function (DUF1206)
MVSLSASTRRASRRESRSALARVGLAARAFVYLVIGWLAIQIALGHGNHEADQRGAFADIKQHTLGTVLLWALAIGFAAYAVWRMTEAVFGTAAEGKKAGSRAKSAARGVVYALLSASTFSFIAGTSTQSQAQQQATFTARAMKHTGGQFLVAAVGAVVVVIGLAMIFEGVSRKFERQLEMRELTGRTRPVVVGMGVIGTVARGIVFTLAGALVIDAAVSYDAQKSTGLDGALRTLADRAYGPWLLGVVALGLIVFGLFGLAEVRWAKT